MLDLVLKRLDNRFSHAVRALSVNGLVRPDGKFDAFRLAVCILAHFSVYETVTIVSMPVPQQENFQQMVNSVLLKYPDYEHTAVKNDINDILRKLMARRPWSGIVKYEILALPTAYATGTITTTVNSNVFTGASTAWPFTDVVSTTLSTAILEPGMQDITPASMTGIRAGQYLMIDGGNAGEEAVFVISITSTDFRARCARTHLAAVTIRCSSLAGQQIRTNGSSPFYTVTGVTSAARLLVDKNWGGVTAATQSYQICQVYVSLGQDVKQVLTMVNLAQTYRFAIDVPKSVLDQIDARRDAAQFPYALSFHEPDPAGSPLYEIYPRATTRIQLPYFYVKQWSPLDGNLDLLPMGIRSDVVVKYARAEAARWPGHKIKSGGIYYDPKVASDLIKEADMEVEFMKLEDDSTAIMSMYWQYASWRMGGGGGPSWFQSHDDLSFDV